MTQHKSITYILTQLDTNKTDYEKFLSLYETKYGRVSCPTPRQLIEAKSASWNLIELIIRTALSRTPDGKAVLSGLEGGTYELLTVECLNFSKPLLFTSQCFTVGDHVMIPEKAKSNTFINGDSYAVATSPNNINAIVQKADYTSEALYEAFDHPLRNSLGLEAALDALDEYFIEDNGEIKFKIEPLK